MCENFGVLYGSGLRRSEVDRRYRVNYDEDGEIANLLCEYCTAKIELRSARSSRPVARHFLSESLPFADCPEEDCSNHGRNVFEVFGRLRRGNRPYHINRDRATGVERLTCNGRRKSTDQRCGGSITLDVPVIKDKDDAKRRRTIAKILVLIRLGLSQTHANGLDISSDAFASNLRRFGDVFRDYHAYRNSYLLKPGWCGQEEKTAVVVTDVLQVSLKRFGTAPARTQRLNVIVSVLRLEETYFALAAHPCYLPMRKSPTFLGGTKGRPALGLEADIEDCPALERHWAGLHTILDLVSIVETKRKRKKKKKKEKAEPGEDENTAGEEEDEDEPEREVHQVFGPQVADGGHLGSVMRSPYADVAHFLVVQRLLSRYKRVFFYMDAAYDLTASAMIAMRDGVRAGRIQIAVFQHEMTRRKRSAPDRGPLSRLPREERLPTAFQEMEERFSALISDDSNLPEDVPEGSTDCRIRAAFWRHAPQGAQSKDGKFAWLRVYPRNYYHYKNCSTLWLTRGPNDSLDDGKDLLLGVTLQSVDSACRALRKRINSFKRPDKAARGVSYTNASYRAELAAGELHTHLLQRNYARRMGKRWSNRRIPAVVMGMTGGDEDAVDMESLLWDFRLGLDHAREISEWMAL